MTTFTKRPRLRGGALASALLVVIGLTAASLALARPTSNGGAVPVPVSLARVPAAPYRPSGGVSATDPRTVTPPVDDLDAALLHARWYATWRRADDAATALAACRRAQRRAGIPCNLREREASLARFRNAESHARAIYYRHVSS